ncbi:uncharacterized protein [Littorina saxatilis]|uniref:Uncharacterized protein n=1 Tax=Littorina saxatilis TaxID=31220 RepID=A0AAN9G7Z8_9CAEN
MAVILLFLLPSLAVLDAVPVAFQHTLQGDPYSSKKTSENSFDFTMDDQANFTFTQEGKSWLQSAPAFLYTEGKRFSAEDGSLKLDHRETESGADKMGTWTSQCFVYMAGSRSWKLCAKAWQDPAWPAVVFQQHFINGTDGSAHDTDSVISGFPSFQIQSEDNGFGFLGYQGCMFGDTNSKIGSWTQKGQGLTGGILGGPVAIFDQNHGVCIMAPFSEFMSTSRAVDGNGRVSWGVMGGVISVPTGFVQQSIVYCGNTGINQVFSDWGRFMRTYYNKDDTYRKTDLTVNYLGFYTDNGAYYYHTTEPNKNYEDTILEIKEYIDSMAIPYRYVQYDDWFYPRGPKRGTVTWEPTPAVSPHGFQYIYNITKLPVAAQNMYWSSKTTYAKANGGKYDFIVETDKAIPQDLTFWMDLLKGARLWGLVMYEQDFLDQEFYTMNATQSTVDVAKTWLMQMGQAARATGLTIQYCMSNPRHAMQSLEIPVVTQARVSGDYHPGNDQWLIGESSIFAHAMGIAPWKDNFWTTTDQPGNPYNLSEPYPELEAVVSTLSTGPVGPSDRVGHTNVSLLMQCCRADGLILKPTKPATAIDKQIWQEAWKNGVGPSGQVWTAYSHVGYDWYFGIVLAVDIGADFKLFPSDAGFTSFEALTVITRSNQKTTTPQLSDFGEANPIQLTSGCTRLNFCMYYTSPVINVDRAATQIVIYGEEMKFVPMSPGRVSNIDVTNDDVIVTLQGTTGETITFTNFVNGKLVRHTCKFGQTGIASLGLKDPRSTCQMV